MRLSHQILKLIHGQKLLEKGSGELPLESYYHAKMDEGGVGILESGWNVANFMATLAAEMGCEPIVLIGMDMSYPMTQEYVKGVEEVSQMKRKQHLKIVGGKDVVSRKDLLMGREFFSQLVKRYPHQRWVNSTKEGLWIEGMEHLAFEEVIASFDKDYDLKGHMHAQMMELDCYQPPRIIEELKESFQRTHAILQRMHCRLEQLYLHQKENPSKTLRAGELALEEVELEEELVYQLYMYPLWQVWKWIFFRNEQTKLWTVEGKIRQLLFFEEVVREHDALLHKIY